MSSWSQPTATILIIDEDPLTLTGMAAVLHMQGYECHLASDREAARRAAEQLPLDLVLCDLDRTQESGLKLCQELRTIGDVEAVPFVYLSSNDLSETLARVDRTCDIYWLHKPFDPDLLIDLVERALWMPHLVKSHVRQRNVVQPPKFHLAAKRGAAERRDVNAAQRNDELAQ